MRKLAGGELGKVSGIKMSPSETGRDHVYQESGDWMTLNAGGNGLGFVLVLWYNTNPDDRTPYAVCVAP